MDMIRQDFRPNYVRAVRTPPGSVGGAPRDPGGGGGGGVGENGVIGNNALHVLVNELERDDRRENADKKKALFRNKVQLEQRRRFLSKGNVVTFTFNDPRSFVDKEGCMQRVLTIAGFEKKNVRQIKLNDYRGNECEVLFEDNLDVDCESVEEKLKRNGMNVSVSKFLDAEEIVMIYGLPLTSEIDAVIQQIKETISPFVKKVVSVTATKHFSKNETDFFHGCLNGNYKAKVVPLVNHQIPNYVPIGKDELVQAKVHYVRHMTEKKVMCNNCYSTEHLANSGQCEGFTEWPKYVEKFESMRDEALALNEDARKASVPSFIRGGEEVRKLREDNIDLQAKCEELEKEKSEIQDGIDAQLSRMREIAKKNGFDVTLFDDSFGDFSEASMMESQSVGGEVTDGDDEPGVGGPRQSTPAPVPGRHDPPVPVTLSREKRRASDLSKLSDLKRGDVIWIKSPNADEKLCEFLKILEPETGKVQVETEGQNGRKSKRTYILSKCQWGTMMHP